MAGTATVPAIAGGATFLLMSISWIDNEEREYTDSFRLDPTASDAELQAVIDAAQAMSNASAYRVGVENIFEGAKNKSNALSAAHESVRDKIRLSYKDISNGAYNPAYVPAPLTSLVGDGGVVNTADALYTAWKAAVDAAIQTGFTGLNVEFVEYQGRNTKVSP